MSDVSKWAESKMSPQVAAKAASRVAEKSGTSVDHRAAADAHRKASADSLASGNKKAAREHHDNAKLHSSKASEIERDERGRFAAK